MYDRDRPSSMPPGRRGYQERRGAKRDWHDRVGSGFQDDHPRPSMPPYPNEHDVRESIVMSDGGPTSNKKRRIMGRGHDYPPSPHYQNRGPPPPLPPLQQYPPRSGPYEQRGAPPPPPPDMGDYRGMGRGGPPPRDDFHMMREKDRHYGRLPPPPHPPLNQQPYYFHDRPPPPEIHASRGMNGGAGSSGPYMRSPRKGEAGGHPPPPVPQTDSVSPRHQQYHHHSHQLYQQHRPDHFYGHSPTPPREPERYRGSTPSSVIDDATSDMESISVVSEEGSNSNESTRLQLGAEPEIPSSAQLSRNKNSVDLKIEVPPVPTSLSSSPGNVMTLMARKIEEASPASASAPTASSELPKIQRKSDVSEISSNQTMQPPRAIDNAVPSSVQSDNMDLNQQQSVSPNQLKSNDTHSSSRTPSSDNKNEHTEDMSYIDKFDSKDEIVLAIEDIDIALHKIGVQIEEFKKTCKVENEAAVIKATKEAVEAAQECSESTRDETTNSVVAAAIASSMSATAVAAATMENATDCHNFVHRIYLENRIKAEQATEPFDFLLPDDSLIGALVGKDFNELSVIKECEQVAQEIRPEVELVIGEQVARAEAKHRELARIFLRKKRQWIKEVTKREMRRSRQQQKQKSNRSQKKSKEGGSKQRSILDIGRDSMKDGERDEDDLTEHEYQVRKRYMKTLAIAPPMVYCEDRQFVFEDENGFVEDPMQEYNERRKIERSWTSEEKRTFMEKFAEFPKDLHIIAKYLPNKTVGDVVNYYYLNKKKSEFKKLMKELKHKRRYQRKIYDEGGSTRAAILPSHDPVSPSIVSPPTAASSTSSADNSEVPRELRSLGITAETYRATIGVVRTDVMLRSRSRSEASDTTYQDSADDSHDWSDNERHRFIQLLRQHGKSFSAISRTLKSKTAAQCRSFFNINKKRMNLVDLLPRKGTRRQGRRTRNTDVQDGIDSDTEVIVEEVQDGSKSQVSYWSKQERENFFTQFEMFGRDWNRISELLKTKTANQVKSYFNNFKLKVGLQKPRSEKSNKLTRRKRKRSAIPSLWGVAFNCDPQQLNPEVFTPDLVNLSHIAFDVSEKGGACYDHMRLQLLKSVIVTPRILRRLRRAGPSILDWEIVDTRGRKRRRVFRPIDPRRSRIGKNDQSTTDKENKQCQRQQERKEELISSIGLYDLNGDELGSILSEYEKEVEWSRDAEFEDEDSPSFLDNLEALDGGNEDIYDIMEMPFDEDPEEYDDEAAMLSRFGTLDGDREMPYPHAGFSEVLFHPHPNFPMELSPIVGMSPFPHGAHPPHSLPTLDFGEHMHVHAMPPPLPPYAYHPLQVDENSESISMVPRYFTSEPAVAFEKLQVLGDVAQDQVDVPIHVDQTSSSDAGGAEASNNNLHPSQPFHFFSVHNFIRPNIRYEQQTLLDPYAPFPSMPEFAKMYDQMQQTGGGGEEALVVREQFDKLLAQEGIPISGCVIPGFPSIPTQGTDVNTVANRVSVVAGHPLLSGGVQQLPSFAQMSEQIRNMEIYPQQGHEQQQHASLENVNSAPLYGAVLEQGVVNSNSGNNAL